MFHFENTSASFLYIQSREMFHFQNIETQKCTLPKCIHYVILKNREMFRFQNISGQQLQTYQMFHFIILIIEECCILKI